MKFVRLRKPTAEQRKYSSRPSIASVGPLLAPERSKNARMSAARCFRVRLRRCRSTSARGTPLLSGVDHRLHYVVAEFPVGLLNPVDPSIATTSIPSRQAWGRAASQVLKTALERPSTISNNLVGPVVSPTGVRSMFTAT